MIRRAIAATITVAFAACATTPPDTGGAGPGWRKGLVLQVGDAASLGPPIDSDCRTRAEAGRARRYVEVQYFVARHAHLRIVPIDAALQVAAGDAIYVRSSGCSDARAVGADAGP